MKKLLVVVKLLLPALVIVTSAACQRKTTSTSMVSYNDESISLKGMEKDILSYVNDHRKSIGKPALQMLDVASAQAAIHSSNMAQKKTPFSHNGFETRVSNINKQAGGSYSGAAENVAYGQMTAEKVVDGWLHSPGHKKNIEGNYNLTGIGVARAKDGTIYYTQIFLRK